MPTACRSHARPTEPASVAAGKSELTPLDDSVEVEMFELARKTTAQHGLRHYEISNFARPGHRCRHNEAYWTGQPYFAAGPGAARFVNGRREVNHRSTTTYIKRVLSGESPVAHVETLSEENVARERLVLGLPRIENCRGRLTAS